MKEGGVRVGTVMRERDGSGGVEGGGGGWGRLFIILQLLYFNSFIIEIAGLLCKSCLLME